MSAQHSPSPWTVRPTPESNNQEFVIHGADKYAVASMHYSLSAREDALLIAGAPDMLDALRMVWGSIDQVNHPAAVAVRAAIRKATGETA